MRTRRMALVVLFAVFGTLVVPASIEPAAADGTPDLLLAKDLPSVSLLGAEIPVTLTATNPSGPDGYNVSFTDTLPAGVSYVSASADTEPTELVQGDGTTVLVWSNVADIPTGATVTLDYAIAAGVGYEPGDSVITTAGVYAHTDPRIVPDIDPTTGVAIGDFSGSDTAARSTNLAAFELTRSEPGPESELLRGVHDHQTVVTLSITNNLLNTSSDIAITEYLPAALEFLGCGGVDNTSGGEEYPGAGVINPGNEPVMSNPCVTPTSLATINLDPDGAGPAPSGVYTRVTWNAATLAASVGAGGTYALDYLVAVPLRENVQTSVGDLTANLGNNTGALTTETEDDVETYTSANAIYTGTGSPETASVVQAQVLEDLRVVKTVDSPTFGQGDTPTFTLVIETSEYAASTGPVTVTDTFPASLDVVGTTPTATSAVTQPDGTTLVTWSLPAISGPNSSTTVTANTSVRTNYRNGDGSDGSPVAADDTHTSSVSIAADVTVVTDNTGTTGTVALDDISSASQSAGGPAVVKEVSTPVGGTLTCGDGSGVTFDTAVATSYRPGDRVCFRLTANFPSNLDTLSPVITDLLPAGFALESWTTAATSDVDSSAMTFTDNDPYLTWTLPDQDAGGLDAIIVLSTLIDTPDAAQNGDILGNLLKLRYANTEGAVSQRRSEASVEWHEPELDLVKGVTLLNGVSVPDAPADGVTVEESDAVTFELAITNAGSVPALDAAIRDVLPADVTCSDISSISNGGTCDGVNNWIDWLPAADIDVAASSAVTLTYVVTVPVGISTGASLANRAGVRTYLGNTNSGSNFTYVPADNIDTSLTANTTAADDDSTVVTTLPTLSKTAATSITEAGNNATSEATIGETVSYTVDVNLPDGVSYYNASIADVVPASLDLLEATAGATLDGASLPVGFTLDADDSTNTVSIDFPDPYVVPDGADQQLLLTFDVMVLDDATNVRATAVANAATLTFRDVVGTERTVDDDIDIDIVEPNITVTKNNDDVDGKVVAGQTVTYTIDVGNPASGSVSVAHDTVVVDSVPDELVVLEAPGDPAEDGDTIAPDGGTWNALARTITWPVGQMDPGTTESRSYSIEIGNPLVAAGTLRNTAEVTTSSIAGTPTIERDHLSPNGSADGLGYIDADDSTVIVPVLDLVKSVSSLTATVGEALTYSLTIDLPEAVIAYDVTAIDDLPPGLVFEAISAVTCDQGGSTCSPDITTAVPVQGSGDVAFFLGDLTTEATDDRTVTIDYLAVVDDVVEADDGSVLQNTATIFWNDSDTIAGTPSALPTPGDFTDSSSPWSVVVNTDEPTLTIDKDVAGQLSDSDTRRAKPGDTLSYTITVRNVGTSAAYSATVHDVQTDSTWAFTDTTTASGVTNTDSDPSGGLEWVIDGPITPGTTVDITYDLTVTPTLGPADETTSGTDAGNSADISVYFGVDGITRAANPGRPYRNYGDVDADDVDIELDLAVVGDFVWFDANSDGVNDPSEPGLPGVDVIATYLGPDATPGGGDDEITTVTTDANGFYTIEHLPGGAYTVTVDETDPDFPAGVTASYDLDGTTISPDGSWVGSITEDASDTDIDFGYTGTGSIGDTVWIDQDGDGIIDAAEGRLANVDVDITWLGTDGSLGGGDDAAFSATTDSSGVYTASNLPTGTYVVAVDASTLPSGYVNVSDPDGNSDGANTVTLSSGATVLDQDFGYAGTDLIGDLVWLDQDADGTQNGSEPGLGGIILELTHFGPDGVSGGPDDSTISTMTDSDGRYEFRSLPPGVFEVVVTGGVPANATNTYDPDTGGPGDARSTVTLTAGSANIDQDFGFGATSVLGDRVWWDRNGDGVQDLGEPGLNGVDVQATYHGADNILGTIDDQVFTTTTTGDGDYLFTSVSDGEYTVEIAAGLAAGFDPTYDEDSGVVAPDASIQLSLTTAHLTADLGFDGTGSIGDSVWLDTDADGAEAAPDFGLANVDIDLTWFGPDGLPGGDDDVTLESTTAPDGTFAIANLPAGQFRVDVDDASLPDGVSPTFDHDDGSVGPDGTAERALTAGEAATDVDFGFAGSGSLGDLVWFDHDGDGSVGGTEVGLGGVTLDVLWDGPLGTESFSTVTASTGAYVVGNLPAGDFTIVVDGSTLPGGMAPTFDLDGGFDASSDHTLSPGASDSTADFGFRGTTSIGDLVWLDLDGDGVQQPTEPGVPAQTVELVWQAPFGPVTWLTSTDTSGTYVVDSLPAGDYTVTLTGGVVDRADNITDPGGEGDSSSTVTLVAGVDDLTQDFGYVGANSVGDLVWLDENRNGLVDNAEPGLAGVDVTVGWFGPDDLMGTTDDVSYPPAQTATDGTFTAAGLVDGSYIISVTTGLPDGTDAPTYDLDDGTDDPDGVSIVTDLGIGDPLAVAVDDHDFGFSGRSVLGEHIWLDFNGDGERDDSEPGISGVTVTLTSAGLDGVLDTSDDRLVGSVVTDDNGVYVFEHLTADSYRLTYDERDLDAGLTPSTDLDGGDPATTAVTLGADDDNRDANFAAVGTSVVEGFVFVDDNGNGLRESGEQPLSDVTVTVRWQGPLGPIDLTVATDENGEWQVSNVPPGDYLVVLGLSSIPEGLVPTVPVITELVVAPGTTSVAGNGLAPGSNVGDLVWVDDNRNDLVDTGEIGAENVRLNLRNAEDDVVQSVETAIDGSYLFEDLVPGSYTVELDETTLADEVVIVFDPDATEPSNIDNTATVAVEPGVDDDSIDFGVDATIETAAAAPALAFTGRTIGDLLLLSGTLVWFGMLLSEGARPRRRLVEHLEVSADGRSIVR